MQQYNLLTFPENAQIFKSLDTQKDTFYKGSPVII